MSPCVRSDRVRGISGPSDPRNNTNVLNEYVTDDERGAWQAEYEKSYGRYEDVAQPTITRAELRVEIRPDEGAVDLRGRYDLVNRTGDVVDSVHVFLNPGIEARSLSLDRPANPVSVDEALGYRIYVLEQALEPGEPLQLAFDVAFRPRGSAMARTRRTSSPTAPTSPAGGCRSSAISRCSS